MTADVTARAPGKLVLAGEFAVLEPGHPGIVAAVSRHTTVELRWGEAVLRAQGRSCTWAREGEDVLPSRPEQPFSLIARAMAVAFAHMQGHSIRPESFGLSVSSTMHAEAGAKLGLGSSAATTAAVLAAVLTAFAVPFDPLTLFKLAIIAHRLALGPGSGIDIAASVYGGHLLYRGVDSRWLQRLLARGEDAGDIARRNWPQLTLEALPKPPLPWQVGWTGEPASTADQLRRLRRRRRFHRDAYLAFLARSDAGVMKLVHALQGPGSEPFLEGIKATRQALWLLSSELGVPIETAKLSRLADLAESFGGAGKSSGAGGGDCGIAFVPQGKGKSLAKAWPEHGITPLDLCAGTEGLLVAQGVPLPR